MMLESGDAENPNPPKATPNQRDAADDSASTANKKWKIFTLSAFLIAVVMAIALGVTLGNKGKDSSGDITSSQIIVSANNGGMNDDKINNNGMNNDGTNDGGENDGGTNNNDGTIKSSTGSMAVDASSLVGPTWYVVEFLDENRLAPPLPQSTITLTFQEDGIMSGNAGCNSYFIDYADLDDSSFKVEGNMAVTYKYCNDLMKQEESYLDLFKGRSFWSNDVVRSPVFDYAISEDGTLELRDDDATVIARCMATPGDSDLAEDTVSPPVFKAQYIRSVGPIESRVRIANPGVANGYGSCSDLKDDILNALKYHANSVIVSQRDSGWMRMCSNGDSCIRDDVCRSGNCTQGVCAPNKDLAPSPSPSSGSTPTVGSDKLPGGGGFWASDSVVAEDSFETNTQVEGVDEADVVKANANYTFAAYGDVLWTWNSTDASEGMMSMTPMSDEPDEECTYSPTETSTRWPTPAPRPTTSFPTGPTTPFPTEDREVGRTKGDARWDGPTRRNSRRRESSAARRWNPCYKPKPHIHSLLLAGPHLTAIVSVPDDWESYSEGSYPIISDNKMVIRVYDVENVPTDGGPLRLLGEQDIRGSFNSARSIGSKGFIISNSYISTWQLTRDLYRYDTQYCGLNNTEYEKMAAEKVLAKVDAMAEQMVGELALQMDGTCDNFFQFAAMQSGNSDIAHESGILSQLVQVTAFGMSSDFASPDGEGPPKIHTNVAGAFASGHSQTVYASQDFVASVNVGYEYDQTSGEWSSATFIQGFDVGGVAPRPFSYAELSGAPLNQYSLDLYKNHLRVVTTESQWWPERKTLNKLWVLKVPERGPETAAMDPKMELTGETGHLGKPGEEVFAVRFMGEKAYVITFEQTDPFYVLNVTDPTNPIVIGELQIPGFSSYLHPINIDGVDMMIGVGRHVDPASGRNDGAKISLFDISDPTNPNENATFIDMGAYSSAGNDFYSFRYLNLNKKLILPKSKYSYRAGENFDGFIVYDVKLGSIAPRYRIQHADPYEIRYGCWYQARMPARSLVFRSQLITILSHSVIGTNLGTGGQNWNVSLDEGLDKTECRGYFW